MKIYLVGGWTDYSLRTYDRVMPLVAVPMGLVTGWFASNPVIWPPMLFALGFMIALAFLVQNEMRRRETLRREVALGIRRIHTEANRSHRLISQELNNHKPPVEGD